MRTISQNFADQLNESPWMGTIHEAGFGIPFQAAYLNIPGASKTILYTGCIYNKVLQELPKNIRSVSQKAVRLMADDVLNNAVYGAATLKKSFVFSLYTSCSHAPISSDSQSHGWVGLSIIKNAEDLVNHEYDPDTEHFSFHFSSSKFLYDGREASREDIGNEMCRFIQWLMEAVLLGLWNNSDGSISWGRAIEDLPRSSLISIDVVNAPGITIEEHLQLCTRDNPLVYHNGTFHRSVDYLRKIQLIYRGSFNPVTTAHLSVGKDALFELSLSNARKGYITNTEAAQRIRELNMVKVPVLITTDCSRFVELDDMLMKRGGPYKYIVGTDTFNAIVDDKFCPTKDYLGQFYGDGSSFLVVKRDGIDIVESERADLVKWEYYHIDYDQTASSTRVRNGEIDLVPESIREMVAKRIGGK
jgi:hypothetical protein